jgi:hypothetical protein
MSGKIQSLGKLPGLVAAAAVACLFATFQLANIVNFPVVDDYYNLLVIAHKALDQGWSVLSYSNLTEQVFSHRPVAVRAAGALQVLLTGEINFYTLSCLGVLLQVAAFCVICVGLYYGRPWSGWWIALLALIYLQPQLSGNFGMAMQGPVQLLPLAVAGAFALRQSTDSYWGWLGAWLCAFIALLAAINAFLVAPLLIAWDLWDRRWKWAAGSVALTVLFALLYFWDYRLVTHSEARAFVAADVVPGFLLLLGGVFKFAPMAHLYVMLAGAAFLFASLWCVWQSVSAGRGFPAAMILFVLGSLGMVAVGRAGWGLDYMLQWRYTSLSLMLLLLVAGSLLPWLASSRVKFLVTASLFLLFALLAWRQYAPHVTNHGRTWTACAMSWWLGTPAFFEAIAGRDEIVSRNTEQIRDAIGAGIYTVPMRDEAKALDELCRQPLPADEVAVGYSVAVAGFRAAVPRGVTDRDYIIFQNSETGTRVAAARTEEGVALRSFLPGYRQPQQVEFRVPRSGPGSDVPKGMFLVP